VIVSVKRSMAGALALALLFLLQGATPLLQPTESQPTEMDEGGEVEWVRFDLIDGVYGDAEGYESYTEQLEYRSPTASSRIGTFDINGLQLTRPIPGEWLAPRIDLQLLIVSNEVQLLDTRHLLAEIEGLSVREFIAPSGLIVQGTVHALEQASTVAGIDSNHPVPHALLVDGTVLDILMLEDGLESLQGTSMRIEGWRTDEGPQEGIDFTDSLGGTILQEVSQIVPFAFSESHRWDDGRYQGILATSELFGVVSQPSLRTLRFEPEFTIENNQAKTNMKTSQVSGYFTTDLDGSGQIVAVADTGLDADHGDFGTRVVANNDVIGDGSPADKHSGHGTHVACSVLGDGAQGGYAGVAPSAELYFQAMENDNSGNLLSPSLNNLLNSAYSAGAYTHTNSWGSARSSDQGKYTSESEDVDDRANYYDRYYNGRNGLTILFAAGNDGPNSGTVGSPSTAKNTITVGNHQNRYSGAPDNIMSSSSRGPTDDGRIKPDILAPGGYVRSCRAQEATDTDSATWSNTYYLEYTGTSMAAPNAAGAAAMVREYLEEIAQRPSPQGALVKALLILGAQDIGSRDIPNNDEGWGRLNLRNTLAPNSGQGIWVDDRSVLSGTGNSKTYSFNISQGNGGFKTVLAWSDERGSSFSNTQLVNNLDLEVTDPSGNVYLGNDFANGRSTQGGSTDSLNNVEVVLIDSAEIGVWTVVVKDGMHGGSKAQPYAIAVTGHGVNDLRPDPTVMHDEFQMSVTIPQVGDQIQLVSKVFNVGNVRADFFDMRFEVDGVEIETKNFDIGPGASKTQVWYWTPQVSGQSTLSFIIDPTDEIEEILENNNRHDIQVDVTAPGVKLSASPQTLLLTNTSQSTTSWDVVLTNTALISTNASIVTQSVFNMITGENLPWYVGSNESNFTLDGQATANISVTLVHPTPPSPGEYRVDLLGIDVDNGVNYPYMVYFTVPELPKVRVEYDYQIVPVSPSEPTSLDVRLFNLGNANIGYDLFVEAPAGWRAGFDTLSSVPGASSGSSGLIDKDTYREVGMTFTPPQVMTAAGAERLVRLTIQSQTELTETWIFDIPIKIETVKTVEVDLETNLGVLRPDSYFSLLFSLEHRGNVDLSFTPSFELPSGWSVTSDVETFELPWASSKNLLFGISGDGNAVSGAVKFYLDNGSDRITWSGQFDVEVLAEPSINFVSLVVDGGDPWDTPFGSGSHPAGVPLNFTWLIGNSADVEWQPTASLSLDSGLFGDCGELAPISKDELSPITCTIIVSSNLPPSSEPSFSLNLDAGGVTASQTLGLLVATVVESSWVQERTTPFSTGSEDLLEVTLTNTGNSVYSHKLVANAPSNWVVSVDGNDIADLEPGESMLVRLLVRADRPGEGVITLALQGAEGMSNPSVELTVSSIGEPVGTSGESLSLTTLALWAVILVVVFLVVAIVSQRRKNPPILPMKSVNLPSTQPIAPVPIHNSEQPSVVCWSCRSQITGLLLGCPGCGARYHRPGHPNCNASEVTTCLNCQADRSTFVEA